MKSFDRWIFNSKFFLVFSLFHLFFSQNSFALNVVRKVEVKSNSEVFITFDRVINKKDVYTDYINNIVQISLNDASIYPAKINSLEGDLLTKVFVYQFSPKIVRCRFTVKEKAESIKDRIKIHLSGKVLSVKFITPVMSDNKDSPDKESSLDENREEINEKALLEKVLSYKGPTQEAKLESRDAKDKNKENKEFEEKPLLKSESSSFSFKSLIFKLSLILLFLGGIAVLLRKKDRVKSLVEKWTRTQFPKRDEKLIQVVSTYYLEPKKKIVVARVSGRLLVLGVSNDSINLITQISDAAPDADVIESSEADLISSGDPADEAGIESRLFADVLGSEKTVSEHSPMRSPVRSRIKSRLEGLKPL